MQSSRLTDLIDVEVLQKIQDSFAAATRLHAVTRDGAGQAVTSPSRPTRLCALLDGAELAELCGAPLDLGAAMAWTPSEGRPFGIVRLAAPIEAAGACLGTVEMTGLLARGEPEPAAAAKAGERLGLTAEELTRLVGESWLRRPEALTAFSELLRSVADVLAELCRRGYESRRQLRELRALSDISTALTQTLSLQERLDLITRMTTETLRVKGCLIRLLDEASGELTVQSVHNLSRQYLEKGPVNLTDSATDQEAILGRVVYVADVRGDARTLYPRESAEEGLCSSLCVALRTKGRAIGTIRAYTGERHEFTEDEVRLFQAIAHQAAAAIENAELYEEARRAQALDRELEAAAAIQRRLMPTSDPAVPGFEIVSRYIPCGSVGGDLFDFVPIQNQHLGIVIADVSGKGVPGAILMAATRAVLRGSIETVYAARDIIAKTNRSLCRDIGEEQFVTLFYGALDTVNRRLTYCNAGHAAPLLFRGSQHCELREGGLLLGVDPKASYEERQFYIHGGDALVFYTDGLTDTMDPEGETFGRQRLLEAVLPHLAAPAREILDHVGHAVSEFARGAEPRDDFTVIVMKVL